MKQALGVPVLVGSAFLAGCSSDVRPTGQSPLDRGGSELSTAASASMLGSPLNGIGDTTEPFACSEIAEARARFSEPGFVDENRVGLFVFYVGVPRQEVKLRVWWDHVNDPTHDDIELEKEDVRVLSDGTLQIRKLVEHIYSGITMPTERRVRVELIIDGRDRKSVV